MKTDFTQILIEVFIDLKARQLTKINSLVALTELLPRYLSNQNSTTYLKKFGSKLTELNVELHAELYLDNLPKLLQ